MNYALGVDLGGSSIKAVAVTPSGEALTRRVLEFNPTTPLEWAHGIRELVARLQHERGEPTSLIGLAAPGLVDRAGLAILSMPGRLRGLEGLHWAELLQTTHPVPLLNDAHAALLGEAWIGAARGLSNVILLTLGTGVGGAALVDGQLLRGHLGRAGHLGHICLDLDGAPDICATPGSLELMIGNCTIGERTSGRFTTTHELVAAHLAGEAAASRVWLRSVRALACAIVSFVNILDPEAVVIGGGIARCRDALFVPLERFLDEMEWRPGGARVKLLPAELGEYAGAFGAAARVMQLAGQPES